MLASPLTTATSPPTRRWFSSRAGITSGETLKPHRRRPTNFAAGYGRWLEPVWGHRLAATDFANNDLNLSNILSDGETITGVVDWDEFALNSRASDLTALAFDCERLGDSDTADLLFARVVAIAGVEGLRCLLSYRILGHLAALARRSELAAAEASVADSNRALDRLEKVG